MLYTHALSQFFFAVLCAFPLVSLAAESHEDAKSKESVKPRKGPYSLDDLRALLRDRNPVLDIAQATLDKYEALFSNAHYAWVPTLKLEAGVAPFPERKLMKQCIIPGHFDENGNQLVEPCPGQKIIDSDSLTVDGEKGIFVKANAKLTLPIYTFGKIAAAEKAARAGVEAAEAGLDYARAQLDMIVKKAYWGAQLTSMALEILNDGLDQMDKAIRQIQKDLDEEGGRFTSNDKRKMQVDLADLEATKFEIEALQDQALEGLRTAAGLEMGEEIELDSKKLKAVKIEQRKPDAYLELAIENRPEVRIAEATWRAKQAQVDMATADFFPNIALEGTANFTEATSADDNPDPYANDPYHSRSLAAYLGASLKLDFAALISKRNQAKADAAKAKAEYEGLKMQMRMSIGELYGRMMRYQKEVAVREQAMKAAKGWFMSDVLNFGLGLASADNLAKSLTSSSKARIAYYQSIYEYNMSVAALSQMVGVELELPNEK